MGISTLTPSKSEAGNDDIAGKGTKEASVIDVVFGESMLQAASVAKAEKMKENQTTSVSKEDETNTANKFK